MESGVTLARLYDSDLFGHFRPAVRLRFVHDALESLAMLQMNPKLEAAHPDLVITPQTIVIGLDGAARVNLRLARETTTAGGSRRDAGSGGSHELRQAASRAGIRPDVYSFGVLVWEALRREPVAPGARHTAAAIAADLNALDVEEEWMTAFVELTRAALGVSANRGELRPRVLMTMLAPVAESLASREQIAESVQGIQSVTSLCVLRPKPPAPSHACYDEPSASTAVRGAQPCDVREEEACAPSVRRRPAQVQVSELVIPPPSRRTATKTPGKALAVEVVSAPARKPASSAPSGIRCLLLLVLLSVIGVAAGLSMRLIIGII